MGEWNPLKIDDFTWDVLKVYIKHGYGDYKLYNTTFFSCQLSDETVCMTLQEFYTKINGNYLDVVSRLQSEALIVKFLKAFSISFSLPTLTLPLFNS